MSFLYLTLTNPFQHAMARARLYDGEVVVFDALLPPGGWARLPAAVEERAGIRIEYAAVLP
jgi:hypothetical protein